jgi:predicted nucleic acid-binding protein
MGKLKIYLDSCCFNRPFDDQSDLWVRLETEAKLRIQEMVREQTVALLWSSVLDYENNDNPSAEKRERIDAWKQLATAICKMSEDIFRQADNLQIVGLKPKDALHLACALTLGADYFITTDKKILNKTIDGIAVINPVWFIERQLDAK